MVSSKLITLSAALLVSAGPTLLARKDQDCNTSKAVMDLPPNQTTLVAPATVPLFILLGVGVQNYTCSGTIFASIGAVASLFDISCLVYTPQFATIQTRAFNIWECAPPAFHYVTAPSGTGISPKWDFTSTGRFAGNATAFVIGAKVGDIPAPTDPATNIDWLQLARVEGDLASQIFCIDTVGGQPPTSVSPSCFCLNDARLTVQFVAGSPPISVKYTAKYYLY
ncbi:hypothetical protein FB451DRAFT_1216165 [Mycena latifolia]|nr:hypothetical protein FB451DRAFT_1216165 [Mycena latifolia]